MKKSLLKVLSIVLIIMLTGLMCITASAAVLPGSGTMKNPYTISTAAELSAFSKAVADGNSFSGKFIVVKSNITANSNFKPIGTSKTPFKGTFDGNGKTLSGFNSNADYSGLFAFTDGAVITSVSVSGTFYATNYAGGIVAYAKDTVIESCTSSARVNAATYAGGIAGCIESGKIVSCTTTSSANIGSSKEYCGGIAGYSAAEITDCTNNAYTYGAKNVGGIAGYSAADITSCTNTVMINASKTNLGGIAGLTEATIKYCKNTGKIEPTVSAKAGKIGGIAGVATDAVITECMNNGTVSATASFAGGIAGYATNTNIENCVATANVSNSGEYAGGIFGFALEGTTSKCVFTALASAKNNTKGGIGAISQGTVSECYYNNSKSDKAVLSGKTTKTTGLAAADFTNRSKLSNLDFTKVWTTNTIHAAYPLLINIPFHTLKVSVSTVASCTKDGEFKGTCTLCKETFQQITPAFGHTNMTVSSSPATCTTAGYKDVLCTVCSETDTIVLPATGHTDTNADNICDVCKADTTVKEPEAEKTFFQKLADFFNSIIEWIRNLFAGIFG